jgi:hypothetical protein
MHSNGKGCTIIKNYYQNNKNNNEKKNKENYYLKIKEKY